MDGKEAECVLAVEYPVSLVVESTRYPQHREKRSYAATVRWVEIDRVGHYQYEGENLDSELWRQVEEPERCWSESRRGDARVHRSTTKT